MSKVMLVTGGSRGIGAAIARLAARRGYAVGVNYHARPDAAQAVVDEIRGNGVRPGTIYTDMHASGGEPGRVDRLKSPIPLRRGGTVDEVAGAVKWPFSAQATRNRARRSCFAPCTRCAPRRAIRHAAPALAYRDATGLQPSGVPHCRGPQSTGGLHGFAA